MVILHIATVKENRANGVYVAVPEHLKAQSKFATVGLLNLAEYRPEGTENCFVYQKPFSLKTLSAPFNDPDIVIFHQVYDPEFISISRVLRKEGIPYIVVPHGSLTKEAQNTKWLKKKVANFLLFNRFVNRAAAVQCLSEKEMNASRVKTKKFIGTNGCALPERKKQKFSEGKIRFCYIGRLDWHIKGLDILLDAFKLLSEGAYKYECELCMYGPDYHGRYDYVKTMIDARGLNGLVTLHQAVFGAEKEAVLLDSDIFIQTSRTEGMPMGILEAFSYGLPCLITKGTTLGDFVENYNAGWVATGDAKSVFEKIVQAVEERETFDEKSKNGHRLVEENFSWEKNANKAIEIYRDIINHRGK